MACQVLKGLEHAHSLGFVHRDIKPENILIGRTPEGLVAKISDFGLAKSFRGIGLSGLTFSGEMRGTIPFMPPEQMLDFKTVLPSGDLYATAATLYYLITGQFIYDQVAEGGDLIRTLLEEPPVPIQQRRPDVPDGLAAVLTKCLARDPDDRYPTAYALRQALRVLLRGRSSTAASTDLDLKRPKGDRPRVSGTITRTAAATTCTCTGVSPMISPSACTGRGRRVSMTIRRRACR